MGDVAALTWPLTGPGGLLYNPTRIRRCLFGHVNHEKAESNFQEQMDALMQENKLRWNFDFENERPLPPGRYLWEKVEKPSDTDSKDTSVSQSQDAEEEPSLKEEQTHITGNYDVFFYFKSLHSSALIAIDDALVIYMQNSKEWNAFH